MNTFYYIVQAVLDSHSSLYTSICTGGIKVNEEYVTKHSKRLISDYNDIILCLYSTDEC